MATTPGKTRPANGKKHAAPAGKRAASAARPRPATQPRKPLPRWRVILHNDDVNYIDHVVASIVMLTPLKSGEAILRMRQAHRTGAAHLLSTHRERAELYVQQFASRRLTVTAEPEK